MKTELKNISANNDLDFYYRNDCDASKNIIEYFETGKRKGFFEPLEFLNLLWEQANFVHKNLADCDLVISHLKELPLTDEQKHVLLGFILKEYGGYPVRYSSQWDESIHNTESDEITAKKQGTLNLIKKEFLSYRGDTPEKEFCKRNRKGNELIYNMQYASSATQEWENGQFGKFEFYDTNYVFIECHRVNGKWNKRHSRYSPYPYKDYPIIAKGFIAFFIKNFNGGEIETETDYYEKYYNPLLTEYKRREGKKLGASKKNLDAEFYEIHVNEERENVKQSAGLYEYLTPEENNLIKDFVDAYFEHIEQFKKNKIEKPQSIQISQSKGNTANLQQKPFADYLIHSDPATLIEKLKPIFNRCKGKKVAIRLVAMREAGLIAWADGENSKLFDAMREIFGDIGNKSGIFNYLADNKKGIDKTTNKNMITNLLTRADIEPFINQMTALR